MHPGPRPAAHLRLLLVLSAVLSLLTAACASAAEIGDETASTAREVREAAPTTAESTTTTTRSPSTTTTTVPATASNGRIVPVPPVSAINAAERFATIQDALLDSSRTPEGLADLGHTEQLIVRTLARNPDWQAPFLDALNDDHRRIAELHLTARRELGMLHSGFNPLETLPAWRIIEPEPLDALVGYYQDAEAATGIQWEILASINLIETGMGRIDGLSSAGAQGPMQFLPTTWDEVSEGGDIDDPEDAIGGAARYLVRRGGLDDIRAGLWGYNNSDHYVNAVLAYTELLELDPLLLRGFYNWEIYVGTEVGTLWLPAGTVTDGSERAADYLAQHPYARTIS